MVVQGGGVAFLSFWVGKEYVNNVYLRQYVQGVARTYLPVLAFLATFGVAVGVSEAYARLKKSEGVRPSLEGYAPSSGVRMKRGSGVSWESGLAGSSRGAFSDVSGPVEGSGVSKSGVSFVEVFSDWRPPVLLKHVESSEAPVDTLGPRPFPVVRRLEPAVDPVERAEERPGATPRVLNRIGPAQALLVPLPPVLRQIGSDDGAGAGLGEKGRSGGTRRSGKRRGAGEGSREE